MKQVLTAIAIIALLLFSAMGTLPLHAQETSAAVEGSAGQEEGTEGKVTFGVPRAAVNVNGRKLLEVTDTTQDEVSGRAERVNRRLERLIEREAEVAPFAESDIVMTNGQPLITLGGEPVLTVTLADAEDHLMSAQDLALMWGGKLSVAVIEARTARNHPLRGVGILVRYSIRDLVVSLVQWLPRLAGAILVWLVFWGLSRFARWITTLTTERVNLDPNLRQLSRTVAFYGVWAAGLVAILSTLGIDSASIAAAVGVSGFVLGFAFKDILSHFFAGLMLLMGRQFQIGGQIIVGEFEGTVERIELRALHLRTFDNRLVTIPNGDVFTSAVTANNAHSHRRREFDVGIGYENDIQTAQRIALDTLHETEGVLDDPAPQVLVRDLGASTVNLRVLYYSEPRSSDWMQLGSDCIRRVKEAFDREGISIPNDIRAVQLRNTDEITKAISRALPLGESTPHRNRNGIAKAA